MNQFIQQATKKRTRNYGENLIDTIQAHLNLKGFRFERDQTLFNERFTTPNKLRLPDLILGTYKKHLVKLILEIDGNGKGNNVHGLDMENATERTKERNKDYHRAGFNYIIIHPEELQTNGFYFKKNPDAILELITYMVSEKLNQIITKESLSQ